MIMESLDSVVPNSCQILSEQVLRCVCGLALRAVPPCLKDALIHTSRAVLRIFAVIRR